MLRARGHLPIVDSVRFGLSIRALRRRRRWTQAQLGLHARVSRSAISRVERGQGDRLSVRALTRITDALGARILLRVLWQGEALDRLLDATHASLVDGVLQKLAASGWLAVPEITFQIGSERGSMDVFARHVRTGHLLVAEVKSVVPDIQATLAGIDRKARLAPSVAVQRGWERGPVSRLLVLPNDRTARRRVEAFAVTFARALPARTVEIRHWLRDPGRPISGILFVSDATDAGTRHRVRPGQGVAKHDRGGRS